MEIDSNSAIAINDGHGIATSAGQALCVKLSDIIDAAQGLAISGTFGIDEKAGVKLDGATLTKGANGLKVTTPVAGWSGSFINGDGDTVTVANGLITGVA